MYETAFIRTSRRLLSKSRHGSLVSQQHLHRNLDNSRPMNEGLGGSAPDSRAESFYSEDGESLHGLLREDLHHGQTERHRCRLCSYSSRYRHHVTLHERTHSGEKPFQCRVCGKVFAQSSHLEVHERIHTRERRYRCNMCTKSFRHSCSLIAHQRVHTGERPYECDICGLRFRVKFCLTRHRKKHMEGAH